MCLSFYGCGEKEDGNVDDMIVETQKVVDDGVQMIKGLDKKGRVLKETCFNGNGEIEVVIEYDTDGNKIKSYEYDDDGVVCRMAEYGKDGETVGETLYEYKGDFLDSWVEVKYTDEGSEASFYSGNGNIKRLEIYDSEHEPVKRVEYYDNGNVKAVEEYEYGYIRYRASYSEEGDVAHETTYFEEGKYKEGNVKVGKFSDY